MADPLDDGTARAVAFASDRMVCRRVATAAAAGVGLAVAGKLAGGGLPLTVTLIVVYPLVLLPLGFYLPAERKRLRALVVRA